ncbi:hypothetical protein Mal35_28500 [Gimesia maris]|nr:hypothetical protein Mal35_28500 [Gimesia maris]
MVCDCWSGCNLIAYQNIENNGVVNYRNLFRIDKKRMVDIRWNPLCLDNRYRLDRNKIIFVSSVSVNQ